MQLGTGSLGSEILDPDVEIFVLVTYKLETIRA
jgi:hypothetical protein